MKKLLVALAVFLSVTTVRADEGMWLLSLLKQQNIDKMQQMGFKLSAEDIYSINQPGIKDAIVGLGSEGAPFRHFCSGEIVSDKGLMITNHHCGFGAIQAHSSVEHDYLSDGFWAYKMEDELTNPGTTASILDRMEDVTERVNALLNDEMSEKERASVIDSISKIIVKEATDNTDFSGQVISMFEGNQFFLFVYTIYKDVRLVGAPPQSIGKFGGDTDNWMWPRHTCDFSMFRIYTAPDGKPAAYAKENVPLKPKHFLPISLKGVKDGDFAMIMGFPGTTDRFATTYSLKATMEITNAIRYKARTESLRIMKEEMDKSAKTRIQYASKYASIANYWKYSNEQNKALEQLNTMGVKQEIENRFADWVKADPQRTAVYGNVLSDLEKNYAQIRKYAVAMSYMSEALASPSAGRFAASIAEPLRKLVDKSTAPKDRKATLQKLRERVKSFFKNYNADLDARLFATMFKVYADNVDNSLKPAIFSIIEKKFKGDYEKFAATIRNTSMFMNERALKAFIDNPKGTKWEEDLVYISGTAFTEPKMMKALEQVRTMRTQIARDNRLFVRGLMVMEPDKVICPNANSTLRLTYGKVGSYKPKDAVFYNYYTTLAGVMEKEGPKGGEFEVPEKLKELYKAKDFGRYANEKGEVATCFITDNDITGGNSGSAVINANGELIGAAFDGNSEAMSGDIDFEEHLQRCINVDMRYVVYIIDKYAGAKNLIEEMTLVE